MYGCGVDLSGAGMSRGVHRKGHQARSAAPTALGLQRVCTQLFTEKLGTTVGYKKLGGSKKVGGSKKWAHTTFNSVTAALLVTSADHIQF